MIPCAIVSLLTCLTIVLPLTAGEKPGERPYEMVWAGHSEDARPPSVDFENLDGWTVDVHNAQATFERSREQPLRGRSVGKLVYRGAGARPGHRRAGSLPPRPVKRADKAVRRCHQRRRRPGVS
jgi:hypothetical protein